jgi:hypothetical protein
MFLRFYVSLFLSFSLSSSLSKVSMNKSKEENSKSSKTEAAENEPPKISDHLKAVTFTRKNI